MLDRADPPPRPPPSRRSSTHRAQWQRAWRRRQRDGVKLIEASAAVVELLIVTRWLRADEADDKAAIAKALDAMAKDALRNKPLSLYTARCRAVSPSRP